VAGKTPERAALRDASRILAQGPRPSPAQMLSDAARWCEERDVSWDVYGSGAVIEDFEAKVANLLGYPAARFVPTGILAQLAALRVWCERAGVDTFGMHPTAHVELHEGHAYRRIHGLDGLLVGPRDRPMHAAHLDAVRAPLGALLTELPAREIGGQLPTWEELEALKQAAATRGVPLHLDGARLWSCGPAYERPLHEITAGFSSCYVSFYKGIGALSGAMLLGPTDFIQEATALQRPMGGLMYTLLPNVVTAAMRFDAALASMPARLAGARALVAALADLPGVHAYPDPPHTHLFHIGLALDPHAANAARDRVAVEHGIWLFSGVRDGTAPGTCRFELTVGEATLALDPQDVRRAFAALFA